jgi:hypothetical protein
MIEPILLAAACVYTFDQKRLLTNASGFFFERDERLFLVTSRHVVIDAPSKHSPDRLEIELHIDPDNLTASAGFSIPLYRDGKSVWRQGLDSAGEIDVAVSRSNVGFKDDGYRARPSTFPAARPVASNFLLVGFSAQFHDTLHHMPVARHAVVASSFGLRFQGQGYFLTDARTHRGTSGAPVVMRVAEPNPLWGDLPWMLLGVHSARLDVGTRDLKLDEALGLNCAWYADILLTLTAR